MAGERYSATAQSLTLKNSTIMKIKIEKLDSVTATGKVWFFVSKSDYTAQEMLDFVRSKYLSHVGFDFGRSYYCCCEYKNVDLIEE